MAISLDKRQQLIDLMKKYVYDQNCIDISAFRKDHPSEYSLLNFYFGGINNAISSNGWIKVNKTKGKSGARLTLRDQLAYDMLTLMREQGWKLEQIGERYQVSRAGISQLYKALDAAAKTDENESKIEK